MSAPDTHQAPADLPRPKPKSLTAPEAQKRPSTRKRERLLPQEWDDFFWNEVVPFSAFRALTPVERSLLYELFALARHTGTDRPIRCSSREAADMLNMNSKTTGTDALSALEAKGFVVSVVRGRPHKSERVAGNWRLTFLPFCGESPTRDYVRRFYKAEDIKALRLNGVEQ
jgi:hypothetical protein